MISIRKERPPDVAAREALLDEAFGDRRWRKSSQRLRDGRLPAEGLAFVATDGKRVVGTAGFGTSRRTGKPALLLGPVAVASDCRNRGIGAALVRHALTRRAGAVIAQSSSSAMRPITAASASRRKTALLCPAFDASASGAELVPERSTERAGSCARPAGLVDRNRCRRPNRSSNS